MAVQGAAILQPPATAEASGEEEAETADPSRELEPGVALLGKVLARFDYVDDTFVPTGNGSADNTFISKSYDASTHFESTTADVLDIYERVTGEKLNVDQMLAKATAGQEDGAGGKA